MASIDAASPSFYLDPYPTYERLRAEGPAFFWEEQNRWCFLNAADVSALLRDRRFGREYLGAGTPAPSPTPVTEFDRFQRTSLLEREPPAHTRLRSLVSKAFLNRAIERLAPRISALANAQIDSFITAGQTELLASYATPIPIIVIAELLGVPADLAPQLLDWSHRMVAMYQLARTPAIEASAESATIAFSAYLRGYVRERRAAPRDDLISLLIAAEASGDRLTEEELIGTCILLLNAGHEATVHAAGNAVKAILESRLDPSRLFATPEATSATVEECLRFDPPLHLFARYAQEDATVAGIPLKSGDVVNLMYGAANRDPARYPAADRFDPFRAPAPAPHLSFGGGIHFCLGAPLARLELHIALPTLFARLPKLRLAASPRYRNSYHFRGLERLDLIWD